MPLLALLPLLPPAAAVSPAVGVLAFAFVIAATWWLSSIIIRWGEDHPVPRGRPSWLGPDAVAIGQALREQVETRCKNTGREPGSAQAVVDELAQFHAHDMVERGFCQSVDPEGVDLEGRLLRLHPTFVGRVVQWQRAVEVEPGWDARRIATELLDELGAAEPASTVLDWAPGNCLGIAAGVSDRRVVACLVAGSHWARLQKSSQREAQPGTWVVEGELSEGIALDSLHFTLQLADGREEAVQGPFPTTDDDWEEGRFRVLVPLMDDLSEARLVAERLGQRSYPAPLP